MDVNIKNSEGIFKLQTGNGEHTSSLSIKEGDIVFCKVKKIEGTCVFVEVEEKYAGTIMFSEIAAGRIRNIREYVSLNKQIVCKVLRVGKDHLELSLRRVTGKERDVILDRNKIEKAFRSILKIVVENPGEVIDKIKSEEDIAEFLQEGKENPKVFEKYLSSDKAKKVAEMLSEKEDKEKITEARFFLKSFSDRGVKDIKNILEPFKAEIHYLGSSMFSIKVSGKDFKEANISLQSILNEIEKKAKEVRAVFEVKEK